ncbi:hypothetical protein GCM10008959_22060 [Deinococcus seoulensis]|uniref:DUF1049 domain-containing protein n=1 Tax=Deinococcus seoulensis TaxID=1837379 RepID=A0ABQ2RS92_9DEIO|nr:hypothetical protein [Deinococcus seoulensis]GGR59836.1 hypothetical protein GCM10008959_22060 [Deinococcus seoulensis]
MRLVSFLQVLLLLGIAAYLALFTLENPELVRLPLPTGRGEVTVSVGVSVSLFLLLGALFMALLLLPGLTGERLRRQRETRLRRDTEDRLTATLQARLAAMQPAPHPTAPAPPPTQPVPAPQPVPATTADSGEAG